MRKFATGSPTRRDVVRGIGVAGLGAAASAPLGRRAFAQTKKPVNISFWTFDNPQQRPWVHKRVKMFMEQNPHVKVDFQWFAFGDLGKKISVGFATGTAPDGFVSQDWFMPVWLDRALRRPLHREFQHTFRANQRIRHQYMRLGHMTKALHSDN
jgi:multiple sugar transport system substrate-binding protein